MRRALTIGFGALLLVHAPEAPHAQQRMANETIGEIHWYGVPARCTFQTSAARALFRVDDPETWRFVFLTMVETGERGLERGYIFVDGVLRELEKLRSAPDNTGRIATVWRSAGEPRINVNLTLSTQAADAESVMTSGRLALIAGDGRRELDVVGNCRL